MSLPPRIQRPRIQRSASYDSDTCVDITIFCLGSILLANTFVLSFPFLFFSFFFYVHVLVFAVLPVIDYTHQVQYLSPLSLSATTEDVAISLDRRTSVRNVHVLDGIRQREERPVYRD